MLPYALHWPTHGPLRVADQLGQRRYGGWRISASGVVAQLVTDPDAAHARRRDPQCLFAELVRHAHLAPGRLLPSREAHAWQPPDRRRWTAGRAGHFPCCLH